MAICTICNKKSHQISWSRHQKGSSGATQWPLRAQIHKRTQHPNLHSFKGEKYCTKCLRIVKADFNRSMSSPKTSVSA
jgi:hypothetical protein